MDWLFDKIDRRGKSVANSAQKVVADMHHYLDEQKGKVAELEGFVQKLNSLCTSGLEQDLQRLEIRKRELVAELQSTDEAIVDRQEQLRQIKEILVSLKYSSNENRVLSPSHTVDAPRKKEPITPVKWPSHMATASSDIIQELEEQYRDESKSYSDLKSSLQNMLFLIHRNNSEEVIVYHPLREEGTTDFVIVNKVPGFATSAAENISELSTFEKLMAYGAKVVANHDRDFPSQHSLHVPEFLINSIVKPEFQIHHDSLHSPQMHSQFLGHLIGAFEIPLTPGVIIDVWMATIPMSCIDNKLSNRNAIAALPENGDTATPTANADNNEEMTDNFEFFWVTTPIDSVPFAVLQRMYVVAVSNWGVQSVVQVDLFGRHPEKGHILLESVTSTGE